MDEIEDTEELSWQDELDQHEDDLANAWFDETRGAW